MDNLETVYLLSIILKSVFIKKIFVRIRFYGCFHPCFYIRYLDKNKILKRFKTFNLLLF